MLHKPADNSAPDYALAYKTRIGVYMFILYSFIYAGFVVINIVSPVLMEKIIFAGLNLSVVYGFGLIIFALILALIYTKMCSKEEHREKDLSEQKGGN